MVDITIQDVERIEIDELHDDNHPWRMIYIHTAQGVHEITLQAQQADNLIIKV